MILEVGWGGVGALCGVEGIYVIEGLWFGDLGFRVTFEVKV